MKKIILIFVFVLVTLVGASAQKIVKSYGCKNAFQLSSMGMQNTSIPSYGTWIEVYDNYILCCGTKYVFSYVDDHGKNVYLYHKTMDKKERIHLSPDYSGYTRIWGFSFFNQTVWNQEEWVWIGDGTSPGKNYGK